MKIKIADAEAKRHYLIKALKWGLGASYFGAA
jgi:hypothetical protein